MYALRAAPRGADGGAQENREKQKEAKMAQKAEKRSAR
jgi:hypothetical protein